MKCNAKKKKNENENESMKIEKNEEKKNLSYIVARSLGQHQLKEYSSSQSLIRIF
jgi:hypothetical protein